MARDVYLKGRGGEAVVIDNRSEAEKAATVGYYFALDHGLSGWGKAANGRSFVACPLTELGSLDARKVGDRFHARDEFSNVDLVSPELFASILETNTGEGDHVHIYNTTTSFRYA